MVSGEREVWNGEWRMCGWRKGGEEGEGLDEEGREGICVGQ